MAIEVNQQTVISDNFTLENIESATFTGTVALTLPVGTTAQRPVSSVEGMFRFNSDTSNYEKYFDGIWQAFSSDEPLGDTIKIVSLFDIVFKSVTFEITNFDSDKTYTISATNGTVTRNEEILTYTASADGAGSITVNSRTIQFTAVNEDLAPAGLIVPYVGDLPSDGTWGDYNLNNRYIVGASTTYPVGSGATTNSGTMTTFFASQSHTGTLANFTNSDITVTTGTATNSHFHSVTGAVTTDPRSQQYKLARCIVSSPLPLQSYLLAAQTLTGVTNVLTPVAHLCLATTPGSYTGAASGNNIRTCTYTVAENGAHTHGTAAGNNLNTGTALVRANVAGLHNHTIGNGTVTDNTRQRILSAWHNATRRFGCIPNGIAMWESNTPPPGWQICDGTNGTPDMRDFYLSIGSTDLQGTSSGNNIHVLPIVNTSSAGSHAHGSSFGIAGDPVASGRHTAATNTHFHSTTSSLAPTSILRYRALVFVRKI